MNYLWNNWTFWSNLFFLVPIYIAISNRMWLHGSFIIATTILSFAYHWYGGHRFGIEDKMTAVALIAVNSVLLIEGLKRHNHPWWFWVTVGTAIFALVLIYIEDRFPSTHGFWHVLSAAVTVFCQMFFLNF